MLIVPLLPCTAIWSVIIQSWLDGTFYKGSTEQPLIRLQQHNDGLSKYTSTTRPRLLVNVEKLPTKKEMLKRELKLKRGKRFLLSTTHKQSEKYHKDTESIVECCPVTVSITVETSSRLIYGRRDKAMTIVGAFALMPF